MNELIDSMMSRKSVRVFLDKAVEEEKKALLIEAARRAPTAGNLMLYSIIDVTDQELKENWRSAVTINLSSQRLQSY